MAGLPRIRSADLVPVDARHHDVEQHQVGNRLTQLLDRLLTGARGDDPVTARTQHGVEQAEVLRLVVHRETDHSRIRH